MNWRQEAYRAVLQSGDVDAGAVYPPVGSGRMWRWRAWVTATGHVSAGRESDERRARQRVEERFRSFMKAAGLVASGGDA